MLQVTAKGISCLWNLEVFVVSHSVKQAFQWSKNWNATFENARQKQLGVYFLSLPNMSNQNKPTPHKVSTFCCDVTHAWTFQNLSGNCMEYGVHKYYAINQSI